MENCVREIASRGFPVRMVTNGWSLTEKRLSGLAAAGLGALTVSLDRKGLLEMLTFVRDAREIGEAPGLHVSFGCEGYLGEWDGKIRDYRFHCMAGISIGSVLADGSISGCPGMRGDFHPPLRRARKDQCSLPLSRFFRSGPRG